MGSPLTGCEGVKGWLAIRRERARVPRHKAESAGGRRLIESMEPSLRPPRWRRRLTLAIWLIAFALFAWALGRGLLD